jgi:hypothetical protein
MRTTGKRWLQPGLIVDVVQILVFALAAIALVLDATGIWTSVPWLSKNLPAFTFISVCTLIVSTVLERRITLQRLQEGINACAKSGIRLRDRTELPSLEQHLDGARRVDILGFTLTHVASKWEYIQMRAQSGCRFRLLMVRPSSPANQCVVGDQNPADRDKDLRYAADKLKPLENTGTVELRYLNVVPSFGLLVLDPDGARGEVQVELLTCGASVHRPSFIVSQTSDKRWYDFFVSQFEALWGDAKTSESK